MRELKFRNVESVERELKDLKEGLDYVKRGVKFLEKLSRYGNENVCFENNKFKNELKEVVNRIDLLMGENSI